MSVVNKPLSAAIMDRQSTMKVANGDSTSPKRYIYTQADMEHFKYSSARKELLGFVSAMGKGLTSNSSSVTLPSSPHSYSADAPLKDLSPALASLRGSLECMSTWIDPNTTNGLPPDQDAKARFGNPVFRQWHQRLTERSGSIIKCLMECHGKYVNNDECELTSTDILRECSQLGYQAASTDNDTPYDSNISPKEKEIIAELRCYLHDSFGHPIRIDYGTGHECSFIIFMLCLCKIGCFNWPGDGGGSKPTPPEVISRSSLSILHAYLNVTRGLQRDYMLEPAGSHGVWGLDDYHCVPFYLGACQMRAREQWQQQSQRDQKEKNANENQNDTSTSDDAEKLSDNSYLPKSTAVIESSPSDSPNLDAQADNNDPWDPSIIHNRPIMESYRGTYMYLSCIHFIQQIKPNVPFFESSPMLNDISYLGSWSKVMAGLLRLFEGEVLDKLPVVQHFVFGNIFKASWTPSKKAPPVAPQRMFVGGPGGDVPVTRAPWAK